jgi:hypothetical protein
MELAKLAGERPVVDELPPLSCGQTPPRTMSPPTLGRALAIYENVASCGVVPANPGEASSYDEISYTEADDQELELARNGNSEIGQERNNGTRSGVVPDNQSSKEVGEAGMSITVKGKRLKRVTIREWVEQESETGSDNVGTGVYGGAVGRIPLDNDYYQLGFDEHGDPRWDAPHRCMELVENHRAIDEVARSLRDKAVISARLDEERGARRKVRSVGGETPLGRGVTVDRRVVVVNEPTRGRGRGLWQPRLELRRVGRMDEVKKEELANSLNAAAREVRRGDKAVAEKKVAVRSRIYRTDPEDIKRMRQRIVRERANSNVVNCGWNRDREVHGGQLDETRIMCYRCGGIGHYAVVCPTRSGDRMVPRVRERRWITQMVDRARSARRDNRSLGGRSLTKYED